MASGTATRPPHLPPGWPRWTHVEGRGSWPDRPGPFAGDGRWHR